MTTEIPAQDNDIRQVVHCLNCQQPVINLPVLQCAHCSKIHILRSFYYSPEPGLWVAECVDLDLTAEGKAPDEAIGKLQEAVFGYLQLAFEGESVKGLVLRPSPLSHLLRYYLSAVRERARNMFARHRHYMPVSTKRLSHCG
jgi:predicted RNase H-like HicB family nuclease